jgi:hypothetical protein
MLAFTPMLLRGDFDPLQIAIVVLFLIGSFIKWLWENWQAKRSGMQPELEEENLGENVRRPQPSGQPPLTPAAPSPLDEWRRAWKEIQEAAKPASPPQPARRSVVPPPLRQQQIRPEAPPSRAVATPAQPAALPVTSPPHLEAVPQPGRIAGNTMLSALHQLRRDPALMRQAILMREVLGPPKALQTSADPAI